MEGVFPFFEALMVFCFGLAWPLSISKSWSSRTNKGKSLFFMCVIALGYLSGVVHKIFWAYDKVIVLYVLNFLMVSTDIGIYFRNRRLDLVD
ncbi:MAG: hypothetical protein ACLFQK_07910 [Fibrobacterota bacterium]